MKKRIFIAYHGADGGDHSSYKQACKIRNVLQSLGYDCFLRSPSNSNESVDDTPEIARSCYGFILVLNRYIDEKCEDRTQGNGKIYRAISKDRWVFSEIKGFLGQYDGITTGDAIGKIVCYCEDLQVTDLQIGNLHPAFFSIVPLRNEENLVSWVRYLMKDDETLAEIGTQPTAREDVRKTLFNICTGNLKKSLNEAVYDEKHLQKQAEVYFDLFGEFTQTKNEESFSVDGLLNRIDEALRSHKSNVMKVEGENGTGKSLFFQTLYLLMEKKYAPYGEFLPVYINLNELRSLRYESEGEKNIEERIAERLQPLFDALLQACRENKTQPVFLIDGLSRVAYSNYSSVWHVVKRKIEEKFNKNFKLLIVVDTGIVRGVYRSRSVGSFGASDYALEISVFRADKYNTEKCRKIVEKYCLLTDHNPQAILASFNNMPFYYLDTFTLDLIAGVKGNADTIDKVLENYCDDVLFGGNHLQKSYASELAFVFSYQNASIQDLEQKGRVHAHEIFRHKIISDYLIACHYVDRLRALNVKTDDIGFFEQILPKEITRFLVPMINADGTLEEKILNLSLYRYQDMRHLCKSEMHYFLGRIGKNSPQLRDKAKNLLWEQLKEFSDNSSLDNLQYPTQEERKILFLYRSIFVNLIYCNDEKATGNYIEYLITSKAANNVNRGFHLEYYGDKPFMPQLANVDFDDKPEKGFNTFSRLFDEIDKGIASGVPLATEVAVFTVCSLIQARINSASFPQDVLYEYVKRFLALFPAYRRNSRLVRKIEKIATYYEMVSEDFTKYVQTYEEKKLNVSLATKTLNDLCSLSEIKRAGWVKYKIPEPESVSDHMYSCWLIGMLYLPEDYPDDSDESLPAAQYNKSTILQLLLFHDWAEAIIGDIRKPDKTQNERLTESREMKKLLLKGTYPDLANLSSLFGLWEDFCLGENCQNINSRVAQDIDTLQGLYKFCIYYLKYPKLFTPEKPGEWFKGYGAGEWKSEKLGSELYKKLILDNPQFADILALLPNELKK